MPEQHVVHKVDNGKKMIDREMRLTAKIGELEMDQVILDLGSDANFFPKKNLGTNGKFGATVVPNLAVNGESTKDYSYGVPTWSNYGY